MEIRVIQKGKEKSFKLGEMKASGSRNLLVLKEKMIEEEEKGDFSVKLFDEITAFIINSFGNKFSENELLTSMDMVDIGLLMVEIQTELNKRAENKIKKMQEMTSIL